MTERVYVCDIYFTINHLLCLCDTCLCLLCMIITIDWQKERERERERVIAHKWLPHISPVHKVQAFMYVWTYKQVTDDFLIMLDFMIWKV